jgi:hypothetical protein
MIKYINRKKEQKKALSSQEMQKKDFKKLKIGVRSFRCCGRSH